MWVSTTVGEWAIADGLSVDLMGVGGRGGVGAMLFSARV